MSEALLGVENSLGGRFWTLAPVDETAVRALASRLDGDDLLARLLARRGIDPDEIETFLDPKLRHLMPDPARFADMEIAAAHILDAIVAGRRVTVFADYDVDGGTSAAQLARYFRAWGRELDLYVPDRVKEGYGPSPEAFRSLRERGTELVITVDCGAAAVSALEEAARIGLPVIVIDHHLMSGDSPPALALVNPNRPDDTSGCGHLAAAGVVFVALVAINRLARARGIAPPGGLPDPLAWLDLAALGTICDMAPLEGVNRAFVASGLKVLARGANTGLRALSDVAGLGRADSTYHAGFVLGPRLNAGGRVGDAWLAARLLATDSREEALAIAEQLHGLNEERKAIEQDMLQKAIAQSERWLDADPDTPVLVADGEGWHPGIIGIVAGRLKDRFHKPAVVIGYGEAFGPLAKGSARSVPGLNIGGLIGQAAREGVIASGGGHAMAGGLALAPSRIGPFRDWIASRAREAATALREARILTLDARLAAGSATPERLSAIERAGPFGAGAPEPRFCVAGAVIEHSRRVGDNHLAFTARDASGAVECMAWRSLDTALGAAVLARARLHLAGRLKQNEWRGQTRVRLEIEDAAPADTGQTA